MKEISLNILDVANNSITAGASVIEIIVDYELQSNRLKVVIKDNGKGMSEEFLRKVTDPFTTTRTTRKVGLGLPLFKDSAIVTGGEFDIESEVGKGTIVKAVYVNDSIDRMPMGALGETMVLLIGAKESIRYILRYIVDGQEYVFDTDDVRAILGEGIPLDGVEVMKILKEEIDNGILEIIGGREIV